MTFRITKDVRHAAVYRIPAATAVIILYFSIFALLKNMDSLESAKKINNTIAAMISEEENAAEKDGTFDGTFQTLWEPVPVKDPSFGSERVTESTSYDSEQVLESSSYDDEQDLESNSYDSEQVLESIPYDEHEIVSNTTFAYEMEDSQESAVFLLPEQSASEQSVYEQLTINEDDHSAFPRLKAVNPDFVCVLEVPAIGLQYPVAASHDNTEYLSIMFDGTENPSGSLFLDMAADREFRDRHTIIFGHNMRDGSMFGSLKQFAQDFTLAQQNPEIALKTEEGILNYQIFAFHTADPGDSVLYGLPETDAEYDQWLHRVREKAAWIDENLWGEIQSVRPDVLTLSTCWGNDHKNNFVVHAVRVVN